MLNLLHSSIGSRSKSLLLGYNTCKSLYRINNSRVCFSKHLKVLNACLSTNSKSHKCQTCLFDVKNKNTNNRNSISTRLFIRYLYGDIRLFYYYFKLKTTATKKIEAFIRFCQIKNFQCIIIIRNLEIIQH